MVSSAFSQASLAPLGPSGSVLAAGRHRSRPSRAQLSAGKCFHVDSLWQRQAAAPALLAAVLLLVAGIAAPERPADQAAICQRHNGVDACRVW